MGLFDHLKFVAGMKAETSLQKMEDPSQVFDYNYTKQLEHLQQLRQGLVSIVQNEKHVEMLESQAEAQQIRYQQQAEQAMSGNREDLARLALQRKEALNSQVEGYKQQLVQLGTQHQKIEAMVGRYEASIAQFQSQKEMVKAQYEAAKVQVAISEVATGISKDSNEMNLAMQRAQEKVLNMQSRATAIDLLMDSGALNAGLIAGSGETDLDRQLAQVSSAHNVDDQLAAMRERLGK